MRFCTVVARNYLAYARVLARSLEVLDDGSQLSVLVLDDVEGAVVESDEPFAVLRLPDLDISARELHNMTVIYDVLELATAVKPWLLHRVLADDDVACYLDPDIEVFASLAPVEALARRHGIVLTPHSTTPLPRDGLLPSEETIRLAGTFNLGFIAVSRDAGAFLAWWSERLRRECRVEIEAGLFVDQKWIDFVPSYFDHTVLVDDGYNVAYWNLFERDVKLGTEGYEVNGRPLRFFHYSGFDPLIPYRLSKYQAGGEERIRLDEHFVVAYLCNRYATRLLDAGHLAAQAVAYRYGYTAHGVALDARARRVCREALEGDEQASEPGPPDAGIPDPFDPATAAAFVDWLAGPGPEGSEMRISRYVRALHGERPDLQLQFPDLGGIHGVQLLEWIRRRGRAHAGVPPEYVPPPLAQPRAGADGLPRGVNVVGYLRAEDGIGGVARSLLDVLDRLGSDVSLRSCTATGSRQRAGLSSDDVSADDVTYDTTIACVNADQLPLLAEQLGPRLPVAATTIGIWAWEVERFPQWMARSATLVDEIWTYSRHAADALAPSCSVPVHVFSPPVAVPPDRGPIDRAAFGLSDDFTFLFCFDFASGFERKNPLGLVEAFRRAFAPGAGPRLVIKSVNGPASRVAWARLNAAADDRADIELRDGYEPGGRQRGLMGACDCYVSLHRAEGYGLTMAEAMAMGRPVIGTAYSGNLEFMTAENSMLVPYEMTRIPFGCSPYPPDASWAEPDLDAAADAMRRAAGDPAAAAALGARARAHIARELSIDAKVGFVRTRLDDIRSSR
jgi:glycosyltransferase involved in cell wall biosynthesis